MSWRSEASLGTGRQGIEARATAGRLIARVAGGMDALGALAADIDLLGVARID